MKIQELEARSGLDRATIRYYERESLLSPARLENGYRDYSQEDARELERIVLLRELGIPLETIRRLQQGSADFGEVVVQQIKVLENRVDHMQQAKRVCQQIGADGILYRDLDGSKYQQLLHTPQLPAGTTKPAACRQTFREVIPRERHPVRRLLARLMDHQIVNCLVYLLIVMVFRWRPVTDFMTSAISYCSWLLMIPLEALWIHFTKTTPGKWMFGIRITSDDGENLSFRQALSRAGVVFRDGMGFAIPIFELYRMFRSYQQHRDTVDLDWDVDCEVTYTKWNLFKKLAIPVAVAASVGLITVASFDAVLPHHRTIDMSISNFSDNYNVYNKLFYDGNAQSLNSDGKTNDYLNPADHSYYRLENGENVPIARFEGFTYDLEGEKVSGISLKQEGYDVYFSLPLSGKSDSDDTASAWLPVEGKIAMITAVASRPSMTVKKLESFIESMDEKLKEDASAGITWIVEDVRFFWQVDADLFYEYQNSNHSPIYEYSLLLNIEFLS